MSDGGFDDCGHGLVGGAGEEGGQVWEDGDDGDEEEEACEGVEEDGADYGFGDLGSGVFYFFAHSKI